MKNFFTAFLILLTATVISAQQDQKAKEILDQVSKKTQSFQTISAKFVFSMENKKENINEINNGSIKLKGRKYHVELPDLALKYIPTAEQYGTIWKPAIR